MAAHSEFAPEASPIERRQDAYFWRLLMTGVCFSLFGLGALVVGVVLLPLVKIIPASRERKRARARVVKRKQFKGFTLRELKQLRAGDFVVHVDKGIGRFVGLESISVGGSRVEAV